MGFGILFVRKRLDLECPNHFEKCNHKDMMQILIKNSVHEAVLPQQGFILLICILLQPHHFVNNTVRAFDQPDQHKHIEDNFGQITPHHCGCLAA